PRRAPRRLPEVKIFTIWNEPNHPGFLQPVGAAPAIYRGLVRAAFPAIKSVRPDARVLVGATSSTGDDSGLERRSTPPLRFLRELACVDAALDPLPGCDGP